MRPLLVVEDEIAALGRRALQELAAGEAHVARAAPAASGGSAAWRARRRRQPERLQRHQQRLAVHVLVQERQAEEVALVVAACAPAPRAWRASVSLDVAEDRVARRVRQAPSARRAARCAESKSGVGARQQRRRRQPAGAVAPASAGTRTPGTSAMCASSQSGGFTIARQGTCALRVGEVRVERRAYTRAHRASAARERVDIVEIRHGVGPEQTCPSSSSRPARARPTTATGAPRSAGRGLLAPESRR